MIEQVIVTVVCTLIGFWFGYFCRKKMEALK